MEEALLPKLSEIRHAIENRMEVLKESKDIPKDPLLVLASKVMKLKGNLKIELDKEYFELKGSMFIVCEECDTHMLKKKRGGRQATVCEPCRQTQFNRERTKKRRDADREARVAFDSRVPFSKLTPQEAVERYGILKRQYKSVVQKLATLKKKAVNGDPVASAQKVQNPEFMTPLLPWPFYLNYNPVIAQEYSAPSPPTMRPPSAPKKRAPRSLKKITVNESGGICDLVPGSGRNEGKPLVEEVTKEEDIAIESQERNEEEIAYETLDHASIGFTSEEEEIEVPPSSHGDDSGDEEGDDATERQEKTNEIDGQLV